MFCLSLAFLPKYNGSLRQCSIYEQTQFIPLDSVKPSLEPQLHGLLLEQIQFQLLMTIYINVYGFVFHYPIGAMLFSFTFQHCNSINEKNTFKRINANYSSYLQGPFTSTLSRGQYNIFILCHEHKLQNLLPRLQCPYFHQRLSGTKP